VTSDAGPGPHRYSVGDLVRVRDDQPDGNPRTPRHVRGKVGTVVALHGQIPNPLDHRDPYPPLCTVRFGLQELTGRPGPDYVTADLHEDWLEPAHRNG
jgi:nitrile hydratase